MTIHCHACNRVWNTDKMPSICLHCGARNIERVNKIQRDSEYAPEIIYKCDGFYCKEKGNKNGKS